MDAPKTLEDWVSFLEGRHLPILNNTRRTLQELEPYDDISVVQFTNIALTDPGVILAILRRAAESTSQNLGGDIQTISAAAMVIGTSNMRDVVEKMKQIDHYMNSDTKNIYMHVVSRAYHAAFQAYSIARIHHDSNPEEIFTTTMLQDIGTLMLLAHASDALKSLTQFLNLDHEEIQQETLGFTLQQLSAALAAHWRLSAFIQQSLTEASEQPEHPRLHDIYLGKRLAGAAERGWETTEMTQLLETTATYLHIPQDQLLKEVRDNAIQSAEETPFYGVMPAAATLPQQGEQDERIIKLQKKFGQTVQDSKMQQHSASAASFNVSGTSVAPKQPGSGISTHRPHAPATSPLNSGALANTFAAIQALLNGSFDLNQFMQLLTQAIHDNMGMEQAFFAMLSKDRAYLVPRFIFAAEHRFRTLHIPYRNNLFQKLLAKPQALWVNDQNRSKIGPLIPKDFYKTIDVDSFFVITVRIKGKAIGIIYADRRGNGYGLDETDYHKFQELAQILAQGFEKIGQ